VFFLLIPMASLLRRRIKVNRNRAERGPFRTSAIPEHRPPGRAAALISATMHRVKPGRRQLSTTRLITVLFFISGATALIGQVVWMRMLGLVLGNTVWAASAAVSVWMAGMAVGALIGSHLAPRVRRHVLWYGFAEGVIGVFFSLSPWLAGRLVVLGASLGEDLSGALMLGIGQRFLLAVAALILPTLLMGLTLPLLVERLRGTELGERTGLLYGVNTFGAAAGVLVTAYWLLPTLGETGSLAAAALACLLVAGLAVVAESRIPTVEHRPPEATPGVAVPGFLVLAGVMGFASLAAELVWVRLLVLLLGSRVYAFAILLGVYLIGIAGGSLLVRALGQRIGDPVRALCTVQALTSVMLVVQVIALGWAEDIYGVLANVAQIRMTFLNLQVLKLIGTAVLFLPVTLLFGASFPLAVAADPGRRTDGGHAGAVAAANTFGAIGGAIAAPFLLIPWLGSQITLLALVVVHAAVALRLRRGRLGVGLAATGCLAAVTVGAVLGPDWLLQRYATRPGLQEEVLLVEEDLGATVMVRRISHPSGDWTSLELNGINVAGSDPALLAIQQLQGQLPMLQHPDPQRVAHIGFGSGGTCWAVSRHPVPDIHVVEISPRVLTASHRWFAPINRQVLDDPRVRTIINDGRNYLLATETVYDVILSDSIHPVFSGNGALYTIDYFRLCRERLGPNGLISMWLPLYSLDSESFLRILSAFHQVFPNTAVWYDRTTVNEFTVVTGTMQRGPLSIRWEQLENPRLRESLTIGGIRTPTDLAANLLLGPAEVAALVHEIPPHEDDLPFVEYTAGRTLDRRFTWAANLAIVASVATTESPFGADAPIDWPRARAERDAALHNALSALANQVSRAP
jgi:spermidine synthase